VGSEPSKEKRELSPSSFVRRPSGYKMTLMVSPEKEVYRITLRETIPSMKFSNFVVLICSVVNSETSSVQGAADQQGWRNANMQDDVCYIVPESEAKLLSNKSPIWDI
jgi:hypothetical protein